MIIQFLLVFPVFFTHVLARAEVTRGREHNSQASPLLSDGKVAPFHIQSSEKLYIGSGPYSIYKGKKGNIGARNTKTGKRKCFGPDQYFKLNGDLGRKGEILKKELTGHGRSTPMKHLFFRNSFPQMDRVCPKFNGFTDHQKLNFWIWYFASIAATESNCGANEYYPKDPQGVSAGDLQMPERYSSRKWRGLVKGAGGCEAKPPKERAKSYGYKKPPILFMAQTRNNLSCGVEVLAGVLCGFYKRPAEKCKSSTQKLYGHGFWKQLRKKSGGTILEDVRRLPICH